MQLMQGLAKQSIHTMFTEAQLVSFGNFLLKTYGVQVFSSDGFNVPLYQREVTDADFCNWRNENPVNNDDLPPHVNYPSRYSIGQFVWFRLWSADIAATVLCVHFYESKVKYDLELLGDDGDKTRVYNIDSIYVVDKIPAGQGKKG